MTPKREFTIAAALAVAFAGALGFMILRHTGATSSSDSVRAEALAPAISDEEVLRAIREANLQISGLQVRSAGGIVILRGTADAASAERAASLVHDLGAKRVANLITPTTPYDDDLIRRAAERELASTGALQGCVLRVTCDNGVLRVTGTVRHELQKDAALSALRSVRGVQQVQVDLTKI